MNTKLSFGIKAVLPGLIVAQIIAFLQVYIADIRLYRVMEAVGQAGYLMVPNQRIISAIKGVAPAFYGGLFFTLTVGAAVSLLTLAAVLCWVRFLRRRKIFLLPALLVWAGFIAAVNFRGFAPLVSAYFFFIPPAVSMATLRWLPAPVERTRGAGWVIGFLSISLLAAAWLSQVNGALIIEIRDQVLLSNRVGGMINDFYYTYTLYPAEVFKTMDQKLIKTVELGPVADERLKNELAGKLLDYDYLPMEIGPDADLTLLEKGGELVFSNRNGEFLVAPYARFMSEPGVLLAEFSRLSDRYGLFRKFIILAVFTASPVLLYIFVHGLIRFLAGVFLQPRTSSAIASIFCLALGLVGLVMLADGRPEDGKLEAAGLIKSSRWQDRVAGLRIIQDQGLDPAGFQPYRKMLSSPHIPERYWLAKALAAGRRPETYSDLVALLDDPQSNVVCMAYYALGRRGDSRAGPEIISRLADSDHWYEQWYAYRALRSLGWRQEF